MALKIFAIAVVVAFALAGCGQQSSPQKTTVAVPLGPESFRYPCDTAGGSQTDPKRCVVIVKASVNSQGVCEVAAPEPAIAALANSKPAKIVWKLDDPQNFRFCPTLGDGAFLKDYDADQQFSDSHATDQANGDHDPTPTPQCKRHFAMDDTNAGNTANTDYGYRLQFHTKNGQTTCKLDPVIRNG